MKDELEYVKTDLIGLSESDTVEFHTVRVMITPQWRESSMKMEYYFDVTLHDLYDSESDEFVTRRATIRYYGVYEINLVELLESSSESEKLMGIFDCPIMIAYANYDIPYDEELSKDLEDRLQSTWEAMLCAINDW